MLNLPEIVDWRLYPDAPERSVAFSGAHPVEAKGRDDLMLTARALLEAAMSCPAADTRGWSLEREGVVYRCERMMNGGLAVRVIPRTAPTLDDLGVPKAYQGLLLDSKLKVAGGLVLISGLAGSGKSSTLAAVVTGRLRTLGGYALTYENPVEYRMQGFHGTGYCDQNSVDDGDYAYALSRSLRCFPARARSMLFIGEILDDATMVEVFKVMMNGHLVLTTSHGLGIIEAIQRLLSLAGAEDSKAQRALLSRSLRLVIHQDLDEKVHLTMRALVVSPAAEQLIAAGSLLNLKDEIARTEDRLFARRPHGH